MISNAWTIESSLLPQLRYRRRLASARKRERASKPHGERNVLARLNLG
jgi:hypothetical protein